MWVSEHFQKQNLQCLVLCSQTDATAANTEYLINANSHSGVQKTTLRKEEHSKKGLFNTQRQYRLEVKLKGNRA